MAHISMVKELSSQRKVNTRIFIVLHLMYLKDSHQLLPEQEVPRYDPKAPGVFWSRLPPFMSFHVLSCPQSGGVKDVIAGPFPRRLGE